MKLLKRSLDRALICTRCKKGKSILLLLIIVVIMTLLTSSFAIRSAAQAVSEEARRNARAYVNITLDTLTFTSVSDSYTISEQVDKLKDYISQIEHVTSVTIDYEMLSNTALTLYRTKAAESAVESYPITSGQEAEPTNWIKGIDDAAAVDCFANGANKLIAGVYPSESGEEAPLMISSSLAEINGIEIGDTVTLGAGTTLMEKMDFFVCGIFNVVTDENADSRLLIENENNILYSTSRATMTAYYKGTENANSAAGNLYIEIDDPDYIEYLLNEIKKNDGVLWDRVEFSNNDESVDFITQSINNVELLTDKVIFISGISALGILSLLMLISLKERQYEVGVLLSIGESKLGVIVQLLAEIIVIAVFAFILSSVVSFLAAGVLGNALMNNQQTVYTSIDNLGTNVIDVEILFKSYLSGIVIILISTIAPALYMMRKNPKTILLHDD